MAIIKISKEAFPKILFSVILIPIMFYIGILGGLVKTLYKSSVPASLIAQYNKSLDDFNSRIVSLGQTADLLVYMQNEFQKSIKFTNNEAIALELSKIKTDIESIKRDFTNVKEIILQNPEKALSLTLLTKDFNSYRDFTSKYITTLEERIRDNFTLIIGISAGFVFIVFGLLISKLFEKKKEPKSSAE